MATMSLDQFLKHSGRGGGGKRNFLKSWKDTDDHSITVWLHTAAPILALWRHGWPNVVPREDSKTKVVTHEVWTNRLVCHEDEETLTQQFWKDKGTGEREHPPVRCPMCKMIDYVRMLVVRGECDWKAPIFQFNASDPKKSVTITAGGMFNAFGAKSVTDAQRAELRQAGIYLKGKDGAWKQNLMAKLEYAFCIANDAKPEDGVQIAVEGQLLGALMQAEIGKAIAGLGEEEGNPAQNPVAWLWQFDPREETPFDKKYTVTRMQKVKLRESISRAIKGTDPPDLEPLAERFNAKKLRAAFEQFAVVALPWDDFFKDVVEQPKAAAAPPAAAPARVPPKAPPGPPPAPARPAAPPPAAAKPAPAPAPAPAPEEDEDVACDGCAKPMKISQSECPHCHMTYAVDTPAPPPKVLPKRSELRAQRAAEAQAAPAAVEVPENDAQDTGEAGHYPGDPGDDIPF